MSKQLGWLIQKSIGSICRPKHFQYATITKLPKRFNSQEASSQTQTSEISGDNENVDQLYKYVLLKCAGHEREVLDSYEKFLKMAAEHLDIPYVKSEEPFRVIKRKTMLAARFVRKKYRVQYEIRNYYRHVLFKNLTGSTADTFIEYVERNLPDGVLLIVEKHQLGELPFNLESE